MTKEQKIKIPYIEKMNGNLCITGVKEEASKDKDSKAEQSDDNEEDESGKYRVAISFYNKAMLALKMIFEGGTNNSVQVLDSQDQAVDLIRNVEVPVCLNLALCYLKTDKPHHAIKYASQMLDRNFKPAQLNNGEATLQKAHFRRGQAY